MSNWMTSGSARLKAKQNSSFAKRARQRAAVVAPIGPITTLPRRKPSRVKYRYVDGNPIRRRGIAVSIGTTATRNEMNKDGPMESSSNQSCMISSENYSPRNPVHTRSRHRIRHRNSLYSWSSRNGQRRVASRDIGFHHQESQNVASDERYPNQFNVHKDHFVPNQFTRYEHAGRPHITQNSIDGRSFSNHYTPDELEHEFAFDTITNKSHDHYQSVSHNEQHHGGIPRFQKHRAWYFNYSIEEEGSRTGILRERTENIWGTMRNAGIDHIGGAKNESYVLQSNSAVRRTELQDQQSAYDFEAIDSSHFNPYEKENSFGDPDRQQPSEIFAENAQERVQYNVNRGFDTASPHDTGINRFKHRRQPNTDLELDESVRIRHSQSQGPSTISDGFDSFSRPPGGADESRHQDESSASGMRFFDNQNEIDFLGNPLPRSPEGGQGIARFRTKYPERSGANIEGVTPSTAGGFAKQYFEW